MEVIGAISGIGTLIVAFIGVWIALSQIRTASRDAHASRVAEMSWQVYQAYVEPRIRNARGAAEMVAHTTPVPTTAAEYGEKYADKVFKVQDEETVDTNIRRLLRFYNQVGILIDKKLVDEDFVYGLIGAGLKSAWPAIRVSIDYYQSYHGGSTGQEKAEPRPVHVYVLKLYEGYTAWEKATGKTALVSAIRLLEETKPVAALSTTSNKGNKLSE